MRVLVVEDFAVLARTIGLGLRREGMAVDVALDGNMALEHLVHTRYDVVVLDRDLPGVHGDEICRRLVADGTESRVLMLTAAAPCATRSKDSDSAQTTIWPSRSTSPSLWPASAPSGDGVLRPCRPRSSTATLSSTRIRGGLPGRPATRSQSEGVLAARMPPRFCRDSRGDRRAARTGVGRGGRSLHDGSQDDHATLAQQTRRSARHRDGSWRLGMGSRPADGASPLTVIALHVVSSDPSVAVHRALRRDPALSRRGHIDHCRAPDSWTLGQRRPCASITRRQCDCSRPSTRPTSIS